jgi:isopenicillin-N N-acyltransferase-like protein
VDTAWRLNRRELLQRIAACSVAMGRGVWARGVPRSPDETKPPTAPPPTLTVISGSPRERGRQYGRHFSASMKRFLDQEIYAAFSTPANTRDDMLRFAEQCGTQIRSYSPIIAEEMEGMAEGSGLRHEEIVLLTLHEEMYHRGELPKPGHCTAVAAGPPDTNDGNTYVGQTWDWMVRLYGWSSMLLWKRPEGPSVLAYAYPGLWVAAGLNSAGIALCWTSAGLEAPDPPDVRKLNPRVGIPSYVLIAQMLYQPTLQAAVEEARRARQAGWFTFVLADAHGQIASVEGSPKELAVEYSRGHIARTYYGTRQMTRTPANMPVHHHPQCQRMWDLLDGAQGKLNQALLERFFGDHQSTICKHYNTIDVMLFNTTRREAFVSRGPACTAHYRRFTFDSGAASASRSKGTAMFREVLDPLHAGGVPS